MRKRAISEVDYLRQKLRVLWSNLVFRMANGEISLALTGLRQVATVMLSPNLCFKVLLACGFL